MLKEIIQIGGEWILGHVSGIPCRFYVRGHTNLAKEREPGIEIIESLIKFTGIYYVIIVL